MQSLAVVKLIIAKWRAGALARDEAIQQLMALGYTRGQSSTLLR